jgi:hypothetical protein
MAEDGTHNARAYQQPGAFRDAVKKMDRPTRAEGS